MKFELKIIGLNKMVATLVIALTTVLASASCATMKNAYHNYLMRGSIVEAEEGNIYLCIGAKDGAKVGQELNVYHISLVKSVHPRTPPKFNRAKVGIVRITSIVDEHFATGMIISGQAKSNDIVELETSDK